MSKNMDKPKVFQRFEYNKQYWIMQQLLSGVTERNLILFSRHPNKSINQAENISHSAI